MANSNNPTTLRNLLAQPGMVSLPGAYDCITAKIVEAAGFPGAFLGDGAVSVSRLGIPDFGLASLGEVVDRAREICRSISIPVIVDVGTGYGNAVNMRRTTIEIEAAGAGGLFFEDQTWPKKCGHIRGRSLISQEEMVMKVRAAADVRKNKDFVIVARTDALAIEGFEAAVRRLNAYGEAGANVVFIDALESVDQMAQAPKEIAYPMMVNMLEGGKTPYLSAGELEALGFKMTIWPETLLYAGFSAMERVAAEMREIGTVSSSTLAGMTDFPRFNEFLGLEDWYELENKYTHAGIGQD